MRAGFKLVCARGAWLFHEGGGYVQDSAVRGDLGPKNNRMVLVQKAYEAFRAKWDMNLPPQYDKDASVTYIQCRDILPLDRNRYVAPAVLSANICEEIVDEIDAAQS